MLHLQVVEHDRDIMLAADYIIDIGPYAGRLGGEVVFEGTYADLLKKKTKSLTAAYLKGEECVKQTLCKWLNGKCVSNLG